jgi:hypothetical protein
MKRCHGKPKPRGATELLVLPPPSPSEDPSFLSAADNRSQVLAVPIEARYRGQAPAEQPYESWASDRNRPAFSVPIPCLPACLPDLPWQIRINAVC